MAKHQSFYRTTSKRTIAFAWVCIMAMFAIVVAGGALALHYIVTHLGELL